MSPRRPLYDYASRESTNVAPDYVMNKLTHLFFKYTKKEHFIPHIGKLNFALHFVLQHCCLSQCGLLVLLKLQHTKHAKFYMLVGNQRSILGGPLKP